MRAVWSTLFLLRSADRRYLKGTATKMSTPVRVELIRSNKTSALIVACESLIFQSNFLLAIYVRPALLSDRYARCFPMPI